MLNSLVVSIVISVIFYSCCAPTDAMLFDGADAASVPRGDVMQILQRLTDMEDKRVKAVSPKIPQFFLRRFDFFHYRGRSIVPRKPNHITVNHGTASYCLFGSRFDQSYKRYCQNESFSTQRAQSF